MINECWGVWLGSLVGGFVVLLFVPYVDFKMDNAGWHDSIESLLEELADEAGLRQRLHEKHLAYYTNLASYLALPTIILSSIAASGNFLSGSVENKATNRLLINIIGGFSVIVGIIGSIQKYINPGSKMEAHRVAEVSWQKFYNEIQICLKSAPEFRVDVDEFMQKMTTEYTRLFELSPPLRRPFLKALRKKIKQRIPEDSQFKIPFYLNGFAPTTRYIEDN